jgi:hypothetical protein
LDLRVIPEGSESLILKRVHSPVELVPTRDVRSSRPKGFEPIGAGEGHVPNTRNGTPHVRERLVRNCVSGGRLARSRDTAGHAACGVDQLRVRRQWEPDSDQTVLDEVGEIVGVIAILHEIVGVNWTEERIVRVGLYRSAQPQSVEPGLCVRWRELEAVRRHVAVRAGAPIGIEADQGAIVKHLSTRLEGRVRAGDRRRECSGLKLLAQTARSPRIPSPPGGR